jgi:deoxyadenosine/deoxycytidine kinase
LLLRIFTISYGGRPLNTANSKRIIVNITGPNGVGKTTVLNYIQKNYDCKVIHETDLNLGHLVIDSGYDILLKVLDCWHVDGGEKQFYFIERLFEGVSFSIKKPFEHKKCYNMLNIYLDVDKLTCIDRRANDICYTNERTNERRKTCRIL